MALFFWNPFSIDHKQQIQIQTKFKESKMTTVGYNQCNNVAITNYQPNYLNVDLSLVKNEPDSIDYNQTNATYYVQHHQQISPQLPPTPPSPTGSSSNDANATQLDQMLKQQILINQNNQISNQPLTNQQVTSQMCTKMNNLVNDQVSNQIKNQPPFTYLPAAVNQTKQQLLQLELANRSDQQQVAATKYRKNKMHLHNLKPYSLPAADQSGRNPIKTTSISRRNERERKRVKNVNEGFKKLRDHIPNNEKKMSKVETLRSAVKYIRQLKELLNGPGDSASTDFLFNIIHQNATSSLQQAIKNECELSNNSTTTNQIDQQDQTSSSLDYFDLAELLSQ